MLGKIESKRRREQQRIRWLDSITDSMEFEQIPGGSGGQEPGGQWSIGLQRVQLILVTEKNKNYLMSIPHLPHLEKYQAPTCLPRPASPSSHTQVLSFPFTDPFLMPPTPLLESFPYSTPPPKIQSILHVTAQRESALKNPSRLTHPKASITMKAAHCVGWRAISPGGVLSGC